MVLVGAFYLCLKVFLKLNKSIDQTKAFKAHFHFIHNSQIACDPLFEI